MTSQESSFQGDWNANKGYLQLMINYITMSGEYSIIEDFWKEYRVVDELTTITTDLIDANVTTEAEKALLLVKQLLKPRDVMANSAEGQSLIHNRRMEAEAELKRIKKSIISSIHKNNLIMPRKQQNKGVKQLWEEYGLEDDDNTEGTGKDN